MAIATKTSTLNKFPTEAEQPKDQTFQFLPGPLISKTVPSSSYLKLWVSTLIIILKLLNREIVKYHRKENKRLWLSHTRLLGSYFKSLNLMHLFNALKLCYLVDCCLLFMDNQQIILGLIKLNTDLYNRIWFPARKNMHGCFRLLRYKHRSKRCKKLQLL